MAARADARPSVDGGFLQLRGLTKAFDGQRVVQGLDLDVAKGEICALLGPSGCGKTTLLRLIAGIEVPDAGRVVLAGRDMTDRPAHDRPTNLMFQSYALFPHLSVAENIAYGLRREGLPNEAIRGRVDALLQRVQLSALANRKPHQLSGGLQQRVALARSLARQPQVLLLDEPLGALDRQLREQTQRELLALIQDIGVTCLLVTHDQQEAMALASRVAVMREGRIEQVGRPDELYECPATRFVASFVGSVNLFDGRVAADAADHGVVACADLRLFIGRGIARPVGEPVTVALRPEKILLTRQAPPFQDYNTVRGRVRDLAYLGSQTVVEIMMPSGGLLKATVTNTQRQRDDAWTRGGVVWAQWPRTAPVVLEREVR